MTRVTHDSESGLAYVYLTAPLPSGSVARTVACGPDINLDFDRAGRLIGVEILRAAMIHPDTVADAVRHAR